MKNQIKELEQKLIDLQLAVADGSISVNEYQDFYYQTYQEINKIK